jgi:hypothetical protein
MTETPRPPSSYALDIKPEIDRVIMPLRLGLPGWSARAYVLTLIIIAASPHMVFTPLSAAARYSAGLIRTSKKPLSAFFYFTVTGQSSYDNKSCELPGL